MAETNLNVTAKPWNPRSGAPQPHGQPRLNSSAGGGARSLGGGPPHSTFGGGNGQGSSHMGGHPNPASANMMASPSNGMQHQQQQQPPQQAKCSQTAAKLFVGQLPFECTEERLRNLFSAYGSVEHIHILRDTSNRSRGAAFVTYSTVQEADTAIFTLHNRYRMLTNRAIQVSYAKNSPNISPFGTHSALEVHQSYPTNPVPDVAANVRALF